MPQDKANLARIRDNQRRSRAQRKEYLQQLEARLRQIEQQGINVSLEIQVAARRVADENRKLRRLLAQHGVSDDITMAFLRSHSSAKNSPDAVGEGQFKDAVHAGLGIQIFEQPGGCRGPGYGRVARRESGIRDSSALSHQSTAPDSTSSCANTCGKRASDCRRTSPTIAVSQNYIRGPVSNQTKQTQQQISDFYPHHPVSHLASSYQFGSNTFTPPSGLYGMRCSNDDKNSRDLVAQEGQGKTEIMDDKERASEKGHKELTTTMVR